MDLSKYVKELKELLDLMKSHDLAEVELEEEGQKIRLRKTEPHLSALFSPALAVLSTAGVFLCIG